MATDIRQQRICDFPVRIDPVVSGLELSVRFGSSKRAAHFYRVHPGADDLGFSRKTSMIHFFGDSFSLEGSQVLLVYDSVGYLRFRVDRDRLGLWTELTAIAEEQTGAPVIFSSVRLTFDDHEAAETFARLIQDVYEGKSPTGEALATIFQNMAGPPRLVPAAPID